MCRGTLFPVLVVWDSRGAPRTSAVMDADGIATVEFDLGSGDNGYLAANIYCRDLYMQFEETLIGDPAAATAVFTSIRVDGTELLYGEAQVCADPYAPRLAGGVMPIRPMIPLTPAIWRTCPAY
jgi:hypothetical protein